MKLEEKTRVGGKYHKRYDKPRTPADRMLEWEGGGREKAAWLRKRKRELNPFELQEQVGRNTIAIADGWVQGMFGDSDHVIIPNY